MKQKIIILILIIPIILIFTTSVVVKETSVIVNPVVTSVVVDGQYVRLIDFAEIDKNSEKLKIETIVTPSDINVKLNYTILEYPGKPQAIVEVTEDGLVIPKSLGWVKIRVSAMDKFDIVTFNFSCSEIYGIKNKNVKPEDMEMISFIKDEITIGVGESLSLLDYLPTDKELLAKYNIDRNYIKSFDSSKNPKFKLELENKTEEIISIQDKFDWIITGKKPGSIYAYVTYNFILMDEGKITKEQKIIKILINVS